MSGEAGDLGLVEVALGEHALAHETEHAAPPASTTGKRAHVVLAHEPARLEHRQLGRDGHDRLGHHVAHARVHVRDLLRQLETPKRSKTQAVSWGTGPSRAGT